MGTPLRRAPIRAPKRGTLLSAGLLGTTDGLWTKCVTRKPYTCWRCDKRQEKGAKAFRPMTNGNHRMRRLCLPCVVRIVKLERAALRADLARLSKVVEVKWTTGSAD